MQNNEHPREMSIRSLVIRTTRLHTGTVVVQILGCVHWEQSFGPSVIFISYKQCIEQIKTKVHGAKNLNREIIRIYQ